VEAAATREFADSQAAGREVASLVQRGDAILVKGSHGAHMEKVVEALKARFAPVEG